MPLETNIFLVRHGETEWNKHKRLQGNKDSPLTPGGMKQADKVKKSLQQFSIDHAYVSPLKRARDTLEIILKDSELKAVIKDSLREINLGPWEGKTRQETALSHPDEYMAFWEKPDLFNLPGADTFQELQNRMVEELESIFANGKYKNILVVSHWIAIKVAVAHYSSTPLAHLSRIIDPVNGGFLCLSKRGEDVFIQQ
jgi:broad specificity phosphatase PhoE